MSEKKKKKMKKKDKKILRECPIVTFLSGVQVGGMNFDDHGLRVGALIFQLCQTTLVCKRQVRQVTRI